MAPLTDQQRRDPFEIFEDPYDRRSTLVATQILMESWHESIGDPTLADALLDRLVHNAHKIRLKGDSIRKDRKPLDVQSSSADQETMGQLEPSTQQDAGLQ